VVSSSFLPGLVHDTCFLDETFQVGDEGDKFIEPFSGLWKRVDSDVAPIGSEEKSMGV
jgi:hypothetical protein